MKKTVSPSKFATFLNRTLSPLGFQRKGSIVFKFLDDEFYIMFWPQTDRYSDGLFLNVLLSHKLEIEVKGDALCYSSIPTKSTILDGAARIDLFLPDCPKEFPLNEDYIASISALVGEKYPEVIEPYYQAILRDTYNRKKEESISKLKIEHYPNWASLVLAHIIHSWGYYDTALWLYANYLTRGGFYQDQAEKLMNAARQNKMLFLADGQN